MTRNPNIIFFLADDLGWGDLGCYGHDVTNYDTVEARPISIKTPNLDRLAAQGKLFTDFYVNAPMCSPARAAMLTGRFPARDRIHFWMNRNHNSRYDMPDWLDPDQPTLPRLLQKAGYRTAHFGKWHVGDGEGAPDVADYGFDETRILCQGNGPGYDVRPWDPAATGLIVDDTVRFLLENREGPAFINAWPLAVHAPLEPTQESLDEYKHLMSGKHQTAMQVYFAAVTAMDREIGRLIDAVDDAGLADDTIIIFSSDNGPEDIYIPHAGYHGVGMPGPFRGRKRSLYEGGVRTPFVMRWGAHKPEKHVDDVTVLSGVDLLPTFCSLAGAALPLGYQGDGEDMSEALLGNMKRREKPLMWEWRFHGVGRMLDRSPMLAIRDGDWKLLMNPDRSRLELYDLRSGNSGLAGIGSEGAKLLDSTLKDRAPSDTELHSVADKHPEVVERLASTVLAWQEELPPGYRVERPGGDTYRWPREVAITEDDALYD